MLKAILPECSLPKFIRLAGQTAAAGINGHYHLLGLLVVLSPRPAIQIANCQSGSWAKAMGGIPSGSLCGLSSNISGSFAMCEGLNINGGCPLGYTRRQFAEGNSGGIQYIRFCAKD